ncbi:MAG: phospholipase [Bacteroidota bacterium]
MEITYLQTARTGRLATLGQAGPQTRHVWIVFHGYRQLATNFVKKFEALLDDETWILAPEGLSRFYVEGYTGKVGASWMTREDRLDEIADQQQWLARVMEHVYQEVDPVQVKLHVLGFSQGVATAWRWLVQSDVRPDSFVIFAGKVPREDHTHLGEKLSEAQIWLTYGEQDQFMQYMVMDEEIKMLKEAFPQLEWFSFEGKHQVYPEPLSKIKQGVIGEMTK